MDINIELLQKNFKSIFGIDSESQFFSPGRINLIGEHVDYNGGYVFPAAITLGTYGAARKREDSKLRFYSENFADIGVIECDINDLEYKKDDNWTNYAKGVVKFLKEKNHKIETGFDLYVIGNIPNGAGLSSSASLELLVGIVVEKLFNLKVDRLDLIKIGKQTENEFIGVNSGIMDQFAIGMGDDKKAIYLNTNTLDYKLVPLDLGENVIVIMNTNKRRELADSKYNERRSECEKALEEIREIKNIGALCELNIEEIDELIYLIKDGNRLKRVRHAVSENQRTLRAVKALEDKDLIKFGRLVNASHVSLEYDYEVTGVELDTLVHNAWEQEGVIGARMTGAGFGGCAIAIVNKSAVNQFIENIKDIYTKKIGYEPSFYIAEISHGAKVL